MSMKCHKCDPDSIEAVVKCMKEGGVAVIPTDTVYGFSGIVDIDTSFDTDEKIRSIKGRSEDKPLIQLIARPEDLFLYTDDSVPDELLEKWPGPLTIIVKIKKDCALGKKFSTVAFRCPGDEWLRKIISLSGAPLYSTSVNRSGSPVIEEIRGIIDEFDSEVDLIVQDGDKNGSLPSTIVSLVDGNMKVIRQGAVKV